MRNSYIALLGNSLNIPRISERAFMLFSTELHREQDANMDTAVQAAICLEDLNTQAPEGATAGQSLPPPLLVH